MAAQLRFHSLLYDEFWEMMLKKEGVVKRSYARNDGEYV